jgi:hypothetical protein
VRLVTAAIRTLQGEKDLCAGGPGLAVSLQIIESEGRELLKISTEHEKNQVLMRVEGKLIAPWTKELEKAWQELAKILGAKALLLDIRGATFVDQSGIKLLGRIARESNAKILADSPLTRQFADKVRQADEIMKGKNNERM